MTPPEDRGPPDDGVRNGGGAVPLDVLLDAWHDGTIGESDARALAAALRGSAAARRIAHQHLRLAAVLRVNLQAFDEAALVRGTRAALDAQRDEDRFLRVFAERRDRLARTAAVSARRSRVIAGAAAVTALAVTLLVVGGRKAQAPALAWVGDVGAGSIVVRDRKPGAARSGAPLFADDLIETARAETGIDYADGTWAQVGVDSRVALAAGERGTHVLHLRAGRVAIEQDSADPDTVAMVETPHARLRSQGANYLVTAGDETRVDVWAGTVTLASRTSPAVLQVRQGQFAETGGAGVLRVQWQSGYRGAQATERRTGPATQAAAQTDDLAGAGGGVGSVAMRPLARRVEVLDATFPRGGAVATVATDLRDTLYAGRGARLDWESFVPVGAGEWRLGPEGIAQTTLSTDGTQFSKESYAKGVVNQGQIPLGERGSLRVQTRIHIDAAGPAPWNVGVVLLFGKPRTIGCYYSVSPQRRFVTLEASNTPRVPFTEHVGWPRLPAPEGADTYWIALAVIRPAQGDAAVRCRVWADGRDPSTGTLLEGHLPIEGEAERLGLRTFRATATYQNVEVIPSDDPAAIAPL